MLGGKLRSRMTKMVPFLFDFLRAKGKRFGIANDVGWKRQIDRVCSSFKPEDFNVILATGEPFSSFEMARRLSVERGRPYVLDYRDLWTMGPFLEKPLPNRIRNREERLVRDATAVVVVSASMAAALDDQLHCGDKTYVITNGFDPDEVDRVCPLRFGGPAIVYCGTLIPPNRMLGPVMAALALVHKSGSHYCKQVRFHFYGRQGDLCMESARRFGVEDLVILHGFVSRSEILAATKAATAAVVVTSVNSASSIWDNGVVTGKLFEPLGLKTPICLISPRGSDARKIVEEADAGSCFTGDQVEQIAEYIISLCEGRQTPTFKNCSIYSWPELAKRLDEVLTKSLGA